MRLSRNPSHAGRGGFTLIELLVVIAIIAILMALTAAAVMRTLGVGPRTKTRVEIGQLDGSVEAFKVKYGVNMIPSRIALRKFYQDYDLRRDANNNPLNPLDAESVNYLTTIFKGITTPSGKGSWQTRGINWHSSWAGITTAGNPLGSEILEGDQCLVFFLGGIEVTTPTNGCMGFSTDSANPDKLGGDRVSFYEFNSSRLVVIPRSTNPKSVFFSYVDGYNKGSPYAYFSTYAIENNYNRYGSTDCPTLGVWPYAEGVVQQGNPPVYRYLKPKTFQIISAGADGKFGPGSVLTSKTPYFWTSATAAGIPQEGADDQANFNANALGTGPQ
jgi:general secretion pathway protein G